MTYKCLRRPTMSDLIDLLTQSDVSAKQITFSMGDGNVYRFIC